MTIEELTIRTSIQIFQADRSIMKPEGFGTGCIVKYLDAEKLQEDDYTLTPILPSENKSSKDYNYWFVAGNERGECDKFCHTNRSRG